MDSLKTEKEQKKKKVIEGYASTSRIFGFGIFPELKKEVSISEDLFSKKMKEFEDKKVRVTVEEIQ